MERTEMKQDAAYLIPPLNLMQIASSKHQDWLTSSFQWSSNQEENIQFV